MVPTILLALAALCSSPTIQGVGDSAALLEGQQATAHFALHYRPGSRAGASVDRIAYEVEREYAEILTTLGIRGQVDESEPFHFYLYDSVAEMSQITGISGTGGFSTGRESHVPWDNDQTRKHELVHIVVAAMKSTGDEPRNLFFAEGLANAVLRFVHGIPVHAVAAYERRRGSLPELATLVGHLDFYAFLRENPGLNAYDIGGSFFLHLLETYEPKRVMAYYHGRPIRPALGKSLAEIEKQWHTKLDAFPVRPELAALLSSRRGDGGEFTHLMTVEERLPAEVLGQPREWKALQAELVPKDALGEWKIDSKSITVTNPSGAEWTIAEVPGKLVGDCALRVQARIPIACWGVKLRYGSTARGMVLGQGAFIYTEQGGIAHSGEHRLRAGSTLDLLLEVRGGRARLFLDGELALEADVEPGPARVGLGMVGGGAELAGFSVRELPGPPGAEGRVSARSATEEPMRTTSIAFEVELPSSYEEAIEQLTAALAAEGFGILTRIDVKETLKKKLDADFRPYAILGACNPPLAHRALGHNGEVGLMLPCNVTVEAMEGGGSLVRIGDPAAFMRIGDFAADEVLQAVADEARERLRRVAQALAAR